MKSARELLKDADLLLLDFDGPVTKLLPPPSNAKLTDTLRKVALDLGVPLSTYEMSTTDHLAIIRAAHRSRRDTLTTIETEATRLEVEAASISPITPNIDRLLHRMNDCRVPVIIVTNNSPDCAEIFFEIHNWQDLIHSILGRDATHIGNMKPNPWMLTEALASQVQRQPIMLGDSLSDARAAQAANVPIIGMAKNSRRRREFEASGVSSVIMNILDLL